MALKAVLEKMDGLSDEIKAEYKEKDGKYHLDIEGMVPQEQFAQFRDNNRDLNRQLTDAKKQLERVKDLDPEEYQALKEKVTTLEKQGGGGEAKELQAQLTALNGKLEKMQKQYETQVTTLTHERDTHAATLQRYTIDTELTSAALAANVRKSALDDVKLRGREVIRLHEGVPVITRNGEVVYSEKKPSEPKGIVEWLGELATQATHLFESSSGSGAQGSGNTGAGGARVIDGSDPLAFGRNLEDIASGKAIVR